MFCGLPLFHVNGQLVTGLQIWLRGDHVVLATPEGYRGKNVIARFWNIVAHYRVSTFSGVPTIYSALLNVPWAAPTYPASNSPSAAPRPCPPS